jgi:hypothetical protein
MEDDGDLEPLEELPPSDRGIEARVDTQVGQGDAYSSLDPPLFPQEDLSTPRAGPPSQFAPPLTKTSRTVRWIIYIFWVVETLIAIRVVLGLLAANPVAPFSALVYGLTWPFVVIFEGVFPSPVGHGHVLDAAALLALVIYPLVAWALVRLVQLRRRRGPLAA